MASTRVAQTWRTAQPDGGSRDAAPATNGPPGDPGKRSHHNWSWAYNVKRAGARVRLSFASPSVGFGLTNLAGLPLQDLALSATELTVMAGLLAFGAAPAGTTGLVGDFQATGVFSVKGAYCVISNSKVSQNLQVGIESPLWDE